MIAVVLTPEALKARWNRTIIVVALLATVALSIALLIADAWQWGLPILWLGCFPAFWSSLKIVGAIAWDTSFKADGLLKVKASPTQVFAAEVICLLAMLAFHAVVSWVFAFNAFMVFIFLAWLIYAAVAILVTVVLYLPSLLLAKALVRHDS